MEDVLLPFRKDKSIIKTRDMNLHQLPWPRAELAALGDMDVELRVTLSYFIEPNSRRTRLDPPTPLRLAQPALCGEKVTRDS